MSHAIKSHLNRHTAPNVLHTGDKVNALEVERVDKSAAAFVPGTTKVDVKHSDGRTAKGIKYVRTTADLMEVEFQIDPPAAGLMGGSLVISTHSPSLTGPPVTPVDPHPFVPPGVHSEGPAGAIASDEKAPEGAKAAPEAAKAAPAKAPEGAKAATEKAPEGGVAPVIRLALNQVPPGNVIFNDGQLNTLTITVSVATFSGDPGVTATYSEGASQFFTFHLQNGPTGPVLVPGTQLLSVSATKVTVQFRLRPLTAEVRPSAYVGGSLVVSTQSPVLPIPPMATQTPTKPLYGEDGPVPG